MENFENVNHLVLNFYPDGYSIAVKLNEFPVFTSETILETARISYEETSLLDYIENEELPPLLVEMIDSSPKLSQYKIWHNGCLILEVRDKIELSNNSDAPNDDNDKDNIDTYNYRSQNAAKLVSQSLARYDNHSSTRNNNHDLPSSCWRPTNGGKLNGGKSNDEYAMANSHKQTNTIDEDSKTRKYFILLKPTNLSMLYDVLNLTDSKCWSAQDRLQLESQIVLHNSPSLSLEPDEPADGLAENSSANQSAAFCPTAVNSPIEMDTNGNSEYSTLKSRQLSSHKPRLKDIYMNRPIHVSHIKSNGSNSNGGRNNDHHSRIYNLYNNNGQTDNHHAPPKAESLPPELTLQQFLAARRTSKQKSLPFGPTPRFHRYKQSRSYK